MYYNKVRFFIFALDHRGHSLKLYKRRFNLDMGKFAFSNRVCDNWNCLPEHIVTSRSLNMFKNELDRHLRENFSPVWPPRATVMVASGKYW